MRFLMADKFSPPFSLTIKQQPLKGRQRWLRQIAVGIDCCGFHHQNILQLFKFLGSPYFLKQPQGATNSLIFEFLDFQTGLQNTELYAILLRANHVDNLPVEDFFYPLFGVQLFAICSSIIIALACFCDASYRKERIHLPALFKWNYVLCKCAVTEVLKVGLHRIFSNCDICFQNNTFDAA